ncbi:ovarian-specific serine/threonine-protein kinase Lok [Anopheles nili]|uniref:ovarian-specific serine/threonine-protein kinase Lok n=1 Tax=Anopheles nili TaxID=185578 RepID=UPI00237AB9D8|nr:ovarian-specific serine/threonine-protein kinase Lok [Anopheles nili]
MENTGTIPDTQTGTQTQSQYTQESQPIEMLPSYGRLLGKRVAMRSLGTKIPIFYVSPDPSTIYELCHSEFKVGRDIACDLILDESNVHGLQLYRVSKLHFTIKKDLEDLTSPTYLYDHSRNGTYVNKRLIGTNKCAILKNGDTIALVGETFRAFVYYDLRYRVSMEIKEQELLDRYHIGRKLGSGACGTVYLLHDYINCHPYAMKHVAKDPLNERSRPQFLNDPQRVMNEVNIMKSLNHPCVIKMHDIVDKPDSIYMVLEYMKGGDLLTRIISNKYLPEKTAKLYFLQMCHAVKYLHEKGITHRDLKPDNILLEDDNELTLLKVSDFGLSKFVRKNSVMRTICGTPQYVAPEVLQTGGRGAYTQKVDIWSLGVVLFTMLSGTLPFSDDYGSPAVEQIKRGSFNWRHPVWRQVTPAAKKMLSVILRLSPSARPTIDELLQSSWLCDPQVVRQAERLMKIPLRQVRPTPQRTTVSDVENNNASSPSTIAPPTKRQRR